MKFKEYIIEAKQIIAVGDHVKESPTGPFGNKGTGRVCKQISAYWTVKFSGDKVKYEYHPGELVKVKSGKFGILQHDIYDKLKKIDKFIYEQANFKKAYNMLEKLKKDVETLSVELNTM